MEVLSKRKLDIYDEMNSLKRHKFEEEEEYFESVSPMDTPLSSPSRSDVLVCLPRIALDLNELEELTTSYSIVTFSFINWRNSEPLVLLKKVNSPNSTHYIIAHKLSEKWVKIGILATTEIFDKIEYLGNGKYILIQTYKGNSYALIFKVHATMRLSESVFEYEGSGKLVRYLNLGKGLKSIQTASNGTFAITTFDDSFGQCRVFSRQGVCIFDFNLSSNPEIPTLNEPYAINLDSNYLYLYYWDSFPLIRISIDSKEIKIIQSELPIVFAHHFAISSREAIFGGGCPRSTSLLSLPDKEKALFRVDLVTCEYEEIQVEHEMTSAKLYCVSAQGSQLYLKSKEKNELIYVLTLGVDL